MPVKTVTAKTNPQYDLMRAHPELTANVWPGQKAEIFTTRGQSVVLLKNELREWLAAVIEAFEDIEPPPAERNGH